MKLFQVAEAGPDAPPARPAHRAALPMFGVLTVRREGFGEATVQGTFRTTTSRREIYAKLRAKLVESRRELDHGVTAYFYCEPEEADNGH